MTDKQKEAIEYFKKRIDICMENANICDDNNFDEEATCLRKEQILIETVLNLIQTKQAEIEKYKTLYAQSTAERVATSIKDSEKSKEDLEMLYKGCQMELEKKDEWINKLETKLMYALTPTKHELAKRTQEEFKEIIRENIDEDTYTIKRKLKENWNNL